MKYRQPNAANLPGPIVSPQIYLPEFGDKIYITTCVNEILNSIPLRELCDKDGKFPEKVIINGAGRIMRIEKTCSKNRPVDFYSYIIGLFDISLLNNEQKSWFEEAVKNKLKEISTQVKKQNAPKKPRKAPTKKPLTDEKQQKKFDKILKVVESAKKDNTSIK